MSTTTFSMREELMDIEATQLDERPFQATNLPVSEAQNVSSNFLENRNSNAQFYGIRFETPKVNAAYVKKNHIKKQSISFELSKKSSVESGKGQNKNSRSHNGNNLSRKRNFDQINASRNSSISSNHQSSLNPNKTAVHKDAFTSDVGPFVAKLNKPNSLGLFFAPNQTNLPTKDNGILLPNACYPGTCQVPAVTDVWSVYQPENLKLTFPENQQDSFIQANKSLPTLASCEALVSNVYPRLSFPQLDQGEDAMDVDSEEGVPSELFSQRNKKQKFSMETTENRQSSYFSESESHSRRQQRSKNYSGHASYSANPNGIKMDATRQVNQLAVSDAKYGSVPDVFYQPGNTKLPFPENQQGSCNPGNKSVPALASCESLAPNNCPCLSFCQHHQCGKSKDQILAQMNGPQSSSYSSAHPLGLKSVSPPNSWQAENRMDIDTDDLFRRRNNTNQMSDVKYGSVPVIRQNCFPMDAGDSACSMDWMTLDDSDRKAYFPEVTITIKKETTKRIVSLGGTKFESQTSNEKIAYNIHIS